MQQKKICFFWKQQDYGYTLLELMIVLGFISVFFLIAYQLFFFSYRSFQKSSNQAWLIGEVKGPISQLELEVKKARKAKKTEDAISWKSEKEIVIYSDITGDQKPEKIRYRVHQGVLKKSISFPITESYPYDYGSFSREKELFSGIMNENVFTDFKKVNPNDTKDERRKIKITFVLQEEEEKMEIISYVMSKSRETAD